MRPGIAILAVVLLIPSPDREEDRRRIDSLIQQEDWQGAQKALKAYLKDHADSPDEKEEIQSLLDRATGLIGLEKIQKEYQKSNRVRRAADRVVDLLEDHPDDTLIQERGRAILEALRAAYVHVLEDFEGWGKGEEPIFQVGSVTLETDTQFIKEGRQAGRWISKGTGGSFSLKSPGKDWSPYDFFCLWIYACRREGPRMGHIRVEVRTGTGGYFTRIIALDWEGWRSLRVPMKGKKAGFASDTRASWSDVHHLYFYQIDTHPTPFEIVLDDIRLEKAVK